MRFLYKNIMKIGTLTTGAAVQTTINLNYVPQYLYYVATTQLTGIKVTVEGDGTILDLDADGLSAVSGIRRFGAVADSYLIPLADGLVKNKVTEIVFTNSAAQTPDVYAFSLQNARAYITSFRQLVLANSQQDVMDFAYLGIKSGTANDIYQVEFANGLVQRFNLTEFKGWVTLYSNEVDADVIDNVEQNIRTVQVNPDTDRTIYVTKYMLVGDIVGDN